MVDIVSYLVVAHFDTSDWKWRLEMSKTQERRLGAARNELQQRVHSCIHQGELVTRQIHSDKIEGDIVIH